MQMNNWQQASKLISEPLEIKSYNVVYTLWLKNKL